jgi:hypothetical protein
MRLAATVVVVLAAHGAVGWWAVAVAIAIAAVAGVIAGMAAVEARVFDRDRRPQAVVVTRWTEPSPDHTTFARALTAVAAAYLSACEREDRRP